MVRLCVKSDDFGTVNTQTCVPDIVCNGYCFILTKHTRPTPTREFGAKIQRVIML